MSVTPSPRVLITGGRGLVGRHASAALLALGSEIVTLVQASGSLPVRTGEEVLVADLMAQDFEAPRVVEQARADTLVHLAWVTEHGRFWSAEENFEWLERSTQLIEAFVRGGGRRVVVAGTSAEYAAPTTGPCHPTKTPLGPKHPYSEAKHRLHLRLAALSEDSGAGYAWARIFQLLGAGEDKRRLVPDVICNIIRGQHAKCSSGAQIRDFLDARDCGRAIAACALSDLTGPINIASGRPISVASVVSRIAQRLGREDLVQMGALPDRPGEPANLYADITLLERDVGFQPAYDLDQSLDDAIAHWRGRIS